MWSVLSHNVLAFSQLNTCNCLVETCCFTLDQGAGISKVEHCMLSDVIFCFEAPHAPAKATLYAGIYVKCTTVAGDISMVEFLLFVETSVSNGKPVALLTLPRSCYLMWMFFFWNDNCFTVAGVISMFNFFLSAEIVVFLSCIWFFWLSFTQRWCSHCWRLANNLLLVWRHITAPRSIYWQH